MSACRTEQGADLSHLIRHGPATALLRIEPPFDTGPAKDVMAAAHAFLESNGRRRAHRSSKGTLAAELRAKTCSMILSYLDMTGGY